MNRLRTQDDERTLLGGVVTTVFLGCCVALLLTAASGAAASQEVDISVQPTDGEVEAGNETTLQVVVEGATEGVGAHDLEVTLADGDVAEVTNVTFVRDPLPMQNQAEVRDGGTTAVGVGAMGENTYEGAEEIAVLNLTVEGNMPGESTELTVAESSKVGNQTGGPYTLGETPNATLTVVAGGPDDGSDGGDDGSDGRTDDGSDGGADDGSGGGADDGSGGGADDGSDGGDGGSDGSGPGLGVVTGLVALLAVGSLLVARGQADGDGGKN